MQAVKKSSKAALPTLADMPALAGKTVLVRVDLNVPMAHGKVLDKSRITRLKPTLEFLYKKGARVVVMSHFGRPTEGYDLSLSLAPIADALSESLDGKPVKFAVDCVGKSTTEAVHALADGEVLLLENLRFHTGEEKKEKAFADRLAALGEFYVNDTFSCSHRAHSSIVGLAERLPSFAGFLLAEEVENLEKYLSAPKKPMAAIVGGSKISTKLDLLQTLITRVEKLFIGGGMANTFLLAKGHSLGKSLVEKNLISIAQEILKKAEAAGCTILLPTDAAIAESITSKTCRIAPISQIGKDEMMLDIGPDTLVQFARELEGIKTVIWNGPVGAFEHPPFDSGSSTVARMLASLTAQGKISSIAGGGDVNAAIASAGVTEQFTYISTAGGAFLEWVEGKELPGIAALKA
jgi:phosphoglycerate kinase